jgi:A/G-specific adenine glycosylase
MTNTKQYQSLLNSNDKFVPLTKKNITLFQTLIYTYYWDNKRIFPWRDTVDPYQILVSEYMLQQTQTSRVIEKFNLFIQKFPDFASLANASTGEILRYWLGLGYNRRAIYLKKCAEIIHGKYHDKIPRSEKELQNIPGIGPYTASALLAFIYNKPVILIETNIRSVYLHFFFVNQNKVNDKELISFIDKTLDRKNPREWYYALMDYGVMLKKRFKNPNRRSKHYTIQTPFYGSKRELRGKILRLLMKHEGLSYQEIIEILNINEIEAKNILNTMISENLIKFDGRLLKIS